MALTEEEMLEIITQTGGRFLYFVGVSLSNNRGDSIALREELGRQNKYRELRAFTTDTTTYEEFETKALELVGWS